MEEIIKRIQAEIEHTKKLGFKRVKLDIMDVEELIKELKINENKAIPFRMKEWH